jgi:hypothetical protein
MTLSVVNNFLARWYYFWGDLISKPMIAFDFTSPLLYPIYNRWMIKSVIYDINTVVWHKVKDPDSACADHDEVKSLIGHLE